MIVTLIVTPILLALVLVIILNTVVSNIVIFENYKYYKSVYNSLPSRKFYINLGKQVYSHNLGEIDDGFAWFIDTGSFCLLPTHYLHNTSYTYTSIYGWYWLYKYRKWFKENVDINNLPVYRSSNR